MEASAWPRMAVSWPWPCIGVEPREGRAWSVWYDQSLTLVKLGRTAKRDEEAYFL